MHIRLRHMPILIGLKCQAVPHTVDDVLEVGNQVKEMGIHRTFQTNSKEVQAVSQKNVTTLPSVEKNWYLHCTFAKMYKI